LRCFAATRKAGFKPKRWCTGFSRPNLAYTHESNFGFLAEQPVLFWR
jgi:hypothetical protein